LARGAWEGLRQAYGDSPQAALASWRVAELDLRGLASGAAEEANRFAPRSEDANQVVHRAEQRLRSAEAVLSALLDDSRRQGGAGGGEEIFTAGAPLPPREYYEQALHKVRRLLWLMDRNEALSNPRSAEAIGAMLDVNGYGLGHDAYAQRLYDLAGRYEDTPMAMNLKLAVALTQTDRQRRADQLVLIAEQDKDHDAAIEADYELGQLVLQEPPVRGRPDIKGPGEYFARIVHDGPYNPWKALSAERLGLLAIARPPPTSRAAPLE